jgi:hypothetical protein
LLSRVGNVFPRELSATFVGIGAFAEPQELAALVDGIVRSVSMRDDSVGRREASALLQRLFGETPTKADGAITTRLGEWDKTFAERNPDLAAWIGEQRSAMENWDDLPF